MDPAVEFKELVDEEWELDETIEEITCNGKYKLWITDPKTPQDAFINDIYISLQQVKAGDVRDLDEGLREIREELGLDANQRNSH